MSLAGRAVTSLEEAVVCLIDGLKALFDELRDWYSPKEEILMDRLEVRDTSLHESFVIDMEIYRNAVIFVENLLNSDITVYVYGNRIKSPGTGIQIGETAGYTCSSNDRMGIMLTPDTTGWLPFIYIKVRAATAPTSGYVSAWLIKYRM